MFLDDLTLTLHKSLPRYPEALAYLQSREVTDEDILKFRLGYSKVISVPDDGSADRKRFMGETKNGRKMEGQITFPLLDAVGRTIGVGRRKIEEKAYKTFVTDEAKEVGFVFGMHQALPFIYHENRVYVVEGYFDLIAFSKVFPNTVATITSGINDLQYEQLCMYCDTIVVCFDSDAPGEYGRDKALKWGDNVRSMSLGYKDPARCLEVLKLDGFKKYVHGRAQMVAPF